MVHAWRKTQTQSKKKKLNWLCISLLLLFLHHLTCHGWKFLFASSGSTDNKIKKAKKNIKSEMWKSHRVICIKRKLLLLKPIHGSLVFTFQQCRSKSFFFYFISYVGTGWFLFVLCVSIASHHHHLFHLLSISMVEVFAYIDYFIWMKIFCAQLIFFYGNLPFQS